MQFSAARVVYMCSSLLGLPPGSRDYDLSQAETLKIVLNEQNCHFR